MPTFTRRVEAVSGSRRDWAGVAGPGANAVGRRFVTPWGEGLVTVWQGLLMGVELPPLGGSGESPSPGSGAGEDQVLLARWAEELEAYFRGERLTWSAKEVGLDRESLSRFTRDVYECLLSIPPGVTVSYGGLAGIAGYPRAARAVGTAMATNQIPIVIPCHRVIRSDGSLGRYGTDPSWKERLLAHERLHSCPSWERR